MPWWSSDITLRSRQTSALTRPCVSSLILIDYSGWTPYSRRDLGCIPEPALMTDEIRLFFDVSSLLNHIRHARHYTGIQRVVAMLVSEMCGLRSPSSVFITYYDRIDRQHKCLSLEDLDSEVFKSPTLLHSYFFEDQKSDTSLKLTIWEQMAH